MICTLYIVCSVELGLRKNQETVRMDSFINRRLVCEGCKYCSSIKKCIVVHHIGKQALGTLLQHLKTTNCQTISRSLYRQFPCFGVHIVLVSSKKFYIHSESASKRFGRLPRPLETENRTSRLTQISSSPAMACYQS